MGGGFRARGLVFIFEIVEDVVRSIRFYDFFFVK